MKKNNNLPPELTINENDNPLYYKIEHQMAKLRCIDEDTDIGFIFIPASAIIDLEDSTEEQ